MNRIDEVFTQLHSAQRKALVGFFAAGQPDFDTSLAIIQAACQAGVDIVELGVPFSDPTADGPVIQQAYQESLQNGMTLARSIELAAAVRQTTAAAVVIFSYYNLILQFGLERFARQVALAGADGLLVVDLPPEEAQPLTKALAQHARTPHGAPHTLHQIRLIGPTTTPVRARMLIQQAGGFIYLVSRMGVTGAGGLDYEAIAQHTAEIKAMSALPVCIGFGISKGADTRALAPMADGLIVGSALIRLISTATPGTDLPALVAAKVAELRAGMDAVNQ